MSFGSVTDAAGQLSDTINQGLARIEHLLGRQLELTQSNRANFLGGGSLAGGTTVGTTPVPILEANPKRRGLSVQNIGTAGSLMIGLGNRSPQQNAGIVLPPNGAWDGRVSGMVWIGSVTVVGSQAGVTYSWLET